MMNDANCPSSKTTLPPLNKSLKNQEQLISELGESKQLYHTLFNSIDEGFCLIEMIYDQQENPIDWRFLETNPAFEKQNGLYEAEGRRISELAPDMEPYWFNIYGEVARTGEPIRFQNETKALGGRWFDLYAFRIGEPGSHKIAVLFKDITKGKKADEATQYALQYARSLLGASLDPLVTIDAEGKITDVNEASEHATGIPRERLIGTDFCNYFTDTVKAREGYQKVFFDGFVRDYPLAIRHVSGRIMDVLYNASIYKDESGNVLGIFAAARDVTQQNILDQKLREKNIELERSKIAAEQANLAKSDFLSNMSHELRTPLNAILGFAQLLEGGTPAPTETQTKRLKEILKAGWYLTDMINEILDLAKIESGQTPMLLEPVLLTNLLFECQSMFEPNALESGIKLLFSMVNRMWSVRADQTKLKQVVSNLLSNAIKYNSEQGTVEVKCSESALGRIRISVKDNGAGLSAEKLAQLFQPFNRLGQEVGVKEGTGIGLAVSKKLIEMMGGTIGVESAVGVGSEFWIELDKDDSLHAHELIGLADDLVLSPKNERSSYTLLYVEDNPTNLMLVEQIIEGLPHIHMISACDSEHGIALATEQLPDIILMDINLLGISGVEVMLHLRKDPLTKHIPIIAISANAMTRDISQGLEAGFFRYLTKPIKINEFTEVLDAAMTSIKNERFLA
ncbi:PAS domain-containing hybrid sensor histidine kinase/response regulator [Methylotenera versatilis]|uniref:histidine kinase n=1 Tax=Methylotenera versatilis (strain 301) TaxID=666681 RepID=D7DM04_METV0|nr:PAS domain-containing hybrid sensor histidine kinase/response regulator [Methylotenera versatilis]ADI30698.1 PAS/PAC sensor hybrid histidine kinase [Methylotenera versatilis 301]